MRFKPSYYWSFTVFRNVKYKTLYLGCEKDGRSLLVPMNSKAFPDPRALFITNKYNLDFSFWLNQQFRGQKPTEIICQRIYSWTPMFSRKKLLLKIGFVFAFHYRWPTFKFKFDFWTFLLGPIVNGKEIVTVIAVVIVFTHFYLGTNYV